MKNTQEKNQDARMDTPKVISGDSRTASEDTVLSPSVSPDQGRNEPLYRLWLIDQRDGSQNPERWEAYDDALSAFDIMCVK